MRKLPLVTTRSAVEIRGVYGQSVLDLHGQMRRLLAQNTGDPAVGNVFAEPQINPVRGEIAWYTEADGPILPVAKLSPDAQQALWSRLDSLRAQIKSAAERYIASGTQTAGTRADTFRAMLTVTDPARCLFSVGGQPVLAEWGCSLVMGEERSVDLWTIGAARARKDAVQPASDEAPVAATAELESTTAAPEAAREPQVTEEIDQAQALEESAIEPDQPELSKPPDKVRSRRVSVPPVPAIPTISPQVARQSAADWSHEASKSPNAGMHGHQITGLWGIFKYLLLLVLAFLLLGTLIHACSPGTDNLVLSSDSEERQLRAEIASLRDQAGQIAARCASTGTTP